MEYNFLGNTGIKVSKICFGSLTLSSLQVNLTLNESEDLIKNALEKGINFIDTAEYYNNYEKINKGIKGWSDDIVICTKSYAYDAKGARFSVEKALRELNRDYIDIFCLHEQESALTLKGHQEALFELDKMKCEGKVRAIGISTHHIAGVEAAVNHPLIEVVLTIVNYLGLGIVDGKMNTMLKAIKQLKQANKGVYAMKALGGGNLHKDVLKAFEYIKSLPCLDSVALGIQNNKELEFAVDFFCNNKLNNDLLNKINKQTRMLHIASWCTGCGLCVKKCSQKALSIQNKKVQVDPNACILCGYCSGVCPEFCIKMF